MTAEHRFELCLERMTYVPKNEASFHPADLEELGLIPYLYADVEGPNGAVARCLLAAAEDVPRGAVVLSKRCREALGLPAKAAEPAAQAPIVVRLRPPAYAFVQRGIPTVDEIQQPFVKCSPDLVERFTRRVELINPSNGFRLDVELRESEQTRENTVYIDRYTMLLLGYDGAGADRRLAIAPRPECIDGAATEGRWPQAKRWLRRRVLEPLGDLYIGRRNVVLRVGHLYPFDEHHNVARIHPNTRKFLGVEETDKIIVTYRDRSVVLPILDVDTEHLDPVFHIKDKFIDGHLFIGIPAFSRKQLDIPNIGASVQVRRSMKFLLLKHVNKLLLPILALWFTILQLFKDYDFGIAEVLSITVVLLPFVVYASLSEERAKIK